MRSPGSDKRLGGGGIVIDQEIDAGAVAAQTERLTVALEKALVNRIGHLPDRGFKAGPVVCVGLEIGEGRVIWNTPYARYQYYGIVYGPNFLVDVDGDGVLEWRSKKGKKKHPTDRKLTYDTAQNPLAGAHWVDRMKADRMKDILDEARNLVRKELS